MPAPVADRVDSCGALAKFFGNQCSHGHFPHRDDGTYFFVQAEQKVACFGKSVPIELLFGAEGADAAFVNIECITCIFVDKPRGGSENFRNDPFERLAWFEANRFNFAG